MDVSIPSLSATDALVELWVSLAASQHEHGSHLLADANRTRIRDSIAHHIATDRLLVARDDAICGFVMFTLETGGYEQDVTRGLVENLYVLPGYRNEGVGGALLDAAEDELRARGAEVVALEVLADNGEARALYRSYGYRPHRLTLEKRLDADEE